MTYQVGTISKNNLYLRCPYCGDSTRRRGVGHLNIHLSSGAYYCYRCGNGGILAASQFLEIIEREGLDVAAPIGLPAFEEYATLPIADDDRYTLLVSRLEGTCRIWEMRKPDGRVVGYHRRYPERQFENVGHKALGYVGNALLSTGVIRVVEGVYDVVLPHSVCLFS